MRRASLRAIVLAAAFVSLAAVPSAVAQRIPCTDGTAEGYPCQGIDLLARLSLSELGGGSDVSLNDIWGWTDPQTGKRYALVGRSDGTAFVDVSDPENPIYLGSLPTSTVPSSWRDIKVYQNHAFVVSEAARHGLQVFDLTQLRSVSDSPQTFSETALYTGFGRAHNVVVSEGAARAYGVGLSGTQTPRSCGQGYHGVDISDPAHPQFAGCFSSSVDRGYTHDAQCVTYDGPDTEHQGREICLGSDEQGLSIADLTDLSAPVELATGFYPKTGYTHQGWFGEDQRYFFMDDELDEQKGKVDSTRTIVWDLADLDDPVVLAQYTAATPSIDHNQYVVGDFAFQSNYTSGLRILDVSNPAAPVEVGFFDVFPQSDAPVFEGTWSNYPFFGNELILVSSIGRGLFVLDASQVREAKVTAFRVGAAGGTDAVLTWTTVAGIEASGFEVQRQRHDGTFETVGFTSVADSSGGANRYQRRIESLGPGRHVFRLVLLRGGRRTGVATQTLFIDFTDAYALQDLYPNPFRQAASLRLAVEGEQQVRIAVYDLQGRRVALLFEGVLPAGTSRRFRLKADGLASGPYFIRITGETFAETLPVTLVR